MRLCIPGQWDGALRVSGGSSEATVCRHVNAPATFCFSVMWLPTAEWYIQNCFLPSRLLTSYYLIPNTKTACTWEALFRFKSSTKWRDFWVSGSYSDELKFHNGKWAAVIKNFILVFLKKEISILKRSNVIRHPHISNSRQPETDIESLLLGMTKTTQASTLLINTTAGSKTQSTSGPRHILYSLPAPTL